MPRKRTAKALDVDIPKLRRQTRSTAVAGESAGIVASNSDSRPRKRHRAPSSESEIENSSKLQTPRVKRTYGRRTNKSPGDTSTQEVLEEPHHDERNLEVDTPKRSLRRVVLDSVEIVTKENTGSYEVEPLELPESVSNAEIPKTPPSPADIQPVLSSPKYKARRNNRAPKDAEELPKVLPVHLHDYLERQKRAILNLFYDTTVVNRPSDDCREDEAGPSANTGALHQLTDLLRGSTERGEGNSCLLIGPAGSGKSRVFEEALSTYEKKHRPVVVRLNGYVQHTDRLAIREIARQIVEQTGSKTFESLHLDGGDDSDDGEVGAFVDFLPPPAHLPSLIAALPTLPRPVIVLLDAFNIFTEQPRQALLYCLLDTVQSCRAGSSNSRGLAVVGLTSRLDVVNFLEKRVKSRFSHRIFRTASPCRFEEWISLLRSSLFTDISQSSDTAISEWRSIWERSVEIFLQDQSVTESLRDMFGISRDIRRLRKLMTSAILRLDPSFPYLTPQSLRKCLTMQSNKPRASSLMRLKYPTLSLCVAAQHARTAGHDSFTFEMLYDMFARQVRTSSAAPVVLGGGSIGMTYLSKRAMIGAFEELIQKKIFVQAASTTTGLGKEYFKYRCAVERGDIKAVVDRIGQTSLKKWFSKAQ